MQGLHPYFDFPGICVFPGGLCPVVKVPTLGGGRGKFNMIVVVAPLYGVIETPFHHHRKEHQAWTGKASCMSYTAEIIARQPRVAGTT